MNDRGARIGPDLSNLIHRDYASVLRDIVQPSFSINPDYIGHIVAMNDGQVLTGVLRTEQGGLYLGDEKGTVTRLPKDDIASMKPAQTSIMPKGLDSKLTAEEMKNLMTFLLTEPPHMPMDVPLPAPPLRTMAEVSKALAGSQDPQETPFAANRLGLWQERPREGGTRLSCLASDVGSTDGCSTRGGGISSRGFP